MKVDDKVWTWNNWYDIVQIEIHTIENINGADVVNSFIPLDNLSHTREAAVIKMKAFIREQIEIKRNEIFHLGGRLLRETRDEESPNRC